MRAADNSSFTSVNSWSIRFWVVPCASVAAAAAAAAAAASSFILAVASARAERKRVCSASPSAIALACSTDILATASSNVRVRANNSSSRWVLSARSRSDSDRSSLRAACALRACSSPFCRRSPSRCTWCLALESSVAMSLSFFSRAARASRSPSSSRSSSVSRRAWAALAASCAPRASSNCHVRRRFCSSREVTSSWSCSARRSAADPSVRNRWFSCRTASNLSSSADTCVRIVCSRARKLSSLCVSMCSKVLLKSCR